VKKIWMLAVLGVMAGVSAWVMAGCKSAPDLTKENALAMIQAKYDQQAPVSAAVLVNDDGMKVGVTAKYWDRSKAYPNQTWADFKLSDAGKKAVKLPSGGDTIEWHPDSATDTKYVIVVNPVVANHLKAKNAGDPADDMAGTKTVPYDEVTSLEGVPDPVQQMARLSNTKISMRKAATFVLDNGAWKLQSIN
jgi:hypothetical protein